MYNVTLLESVTDQGKRRDVFELTVPTTLVESVRDAFRCVWRVDVDLPADTTAVDDAYENTVIPLEWTLEERRGTQRECADRSGCLEAWLDARDAACDSATRLKAAGVANHVADALLVPFRFSRLRVETVDEPGRFDFFNTLRRPDLPAEIQWIGWEMMMQVSQVSSTG